MGGPAGKIKWRNSNEGGEGVYGRGGQGRALCLPTSLFRPKLWQPHLPGIIPCMSATTPLQGSSASVLTPGFPAGDTEEATPSESSGNQPSSVPRALGQASGGPWLLPKPHPPEVSARTPSPLWPPKRGPWRGRSPHLTRVTGQSSHRGCSR